MMQSCPHCRRKLRSDEPIFQVMRANKYPLTAYVCRDCEPSFHERLAPMPCEGCNRPLVNLVHLRPRRQRTCSDPCRHKVAGAKSQRKRVAAKSKSAGRSQRDAVSQVGK
jgi:hypothetical protein